MIPVWLPTGPHRLFRELARIDAEYTRLAEAAKSAGADIVNLSAQSRLTGLPRQTLEEFLKETPGSNHRPDPVSVAMPGAADRQAPAASIPQAKQMTELRVFFVHYRFRSCGEVFTDGLRGAANQLGIASEHAKWDDPDLPGRVARFRPDLLFVVHGRNFVRRWGDRFDIYRSAVWLLDEPYEVDDTSIYARNFEFVFINDPASLSRHVNAHYLPVCYDPLVHFAGTEQRRYRTGFIGGGNPPRERLLVALMERGWLDYVVGGPWCDSRLQALCLTSNCSPERTAALYRETSIVLNAFRDRHHFNGSGLAATSMNPRIYEALACGALVVSEWRDEIGQRVPTLPTFRSPDEAAALVARLLSDPVARERHRNESLEVLRDDTYADRLRTALEIVARTQPANPSGTLGRQSSQRSGPALRWDDPHMREAARDLNVVRTFDDEWDDLGGVAVRDGAGKVIIAPAPGVASGAERGLAGHSRYTSVDLECEVWITAQAVFLAKIHQQDRLDQTTNSYHVLCDRRRAYVARHNHIFGHIPLARETWQKIRLSFASGQIAVHVGGTLIHRFEDRMLDAGYVFLGAKGGKIHLRDIRLSAPGQTAGADDAREHPKSQASDGARSDSGLMVRETV